MKTDKPPTKSVMGSKAMVVTSIAVTRKLAEQKTEELINACNDIRINTNKIRKMLWWIDQNKSYIQMPGRYSSMAKFLKTELKVFDYTSMTRQLQAAEIEDSWGVDVGTYSEWTLRPIFGKSEKYNDMRNQVIKEAEIISGDDVHAPSTDEIKLAIANVMTGKGMKKIADKEESEDHPLDGVEDHTLDAFEDHPFDEEDRDRKCEEDPVGDIEHNPFNDDVEYEDEDIVAVLIANGEKATVANKVMVMRKWFGRFNVNRQESVMKLLQEVHKRKIDALSDQNPDVC